MQSSLDDMTEDELKATLDRVCIALRDRLPAHTGFIVLCSPFGGRVAQYASNVTRETAIPWILETLLRWNMKDYVDRT